jgi:hypothetical protein
MESLSDMMAKAQAAFPKLPEGLGGRKAKPIGKILLLALQIAEPLQYAYLGGSSMNWVRFMAETHHNFGHFHIRLDGDPEGAMTVMTDEEFRKKS